MKYTIGKLFTLILAITGILLYTQVLASTAIIDPILNTSTPAGFNGTVYAQAVQNDGKIVVGGYFTTYKGITVNRIVRLNVDGTLDGSFSMGLGFNATVTTIAIQDDSKILVGGWFDSYNGTAVNRIVRLNTGGSVDTGFVIGNGCNNPVYAVSIQTDGKILVGGAFTTYNGTAANRIVRLNTGGTIDTGFVIGNGFDSTVYTIAIQNDEKIVVGGQFGSWDGVGSYYIVRLNTGGAKDTGFVNGDGFNGIVFDIKIQSDGKVVVGGAFTTYGLEVTNKIVRINTGGTIDSSFIAGEGFNNTVRTLKIQEDDKILVGGLFTTYSGVSTNFMTRLNTGGSIDSSFAMGNGFNGLNNVGSVYTIITQSNSKILAAGDFSTYSGAAANKIIRLNTGGTIDISLNMGNGFNNIINSIAVQSDGKLMIGGWFTNYSGIMINRIVRLNTGGTVDTSFSIGSGFNNDVNALAIQSDGKIVVGGLFTNYKGTAANFITRINTGGTIDTGFVIGDGFDRLINTVAIQDDGKIIAGGFFSTYNGISANMLVRINTGGTADTGFIIGSGFDNEIKKIAIQDDGKIIVAGMFTTYSGSSANKIIRLNTGGAIDTGFIIGNGFNGTVFDIKIQSGGKILVGGAFTTYSGATATKIIRLNTDGTRDTGFVDNGAGLDPSAGINAIAIQSNGKILIGGGLNEIPAGAKYIIRLTSGGAIDSTFTMGGGLNDVVYSILEQSNRKILIGGSFTNYNGRAAGHLISLNGDSDIVIIPNSLDTGALITEFTTKGYDQIGAEFVGSTLISLIETDGNIPLSLSLMNQAVKLSIPANTIFKDSGAIVNYSGIFTVPIVKYISSVNDHDVASSFKVGSTSESVQLTGGVATLLAPVPSKNIGDKVQVFYSEDNGVTWYSEVIKNVIDNSGEAYVSFTTNHFTDFAIVDRTGSGSFTINNDVASGDSESVSLNSSTTPSATYMRFSNNNSTRSSRYTYATSTGWALSTGYGTKTVYAEFDIDGDGGSDVDTSDSILYIDTIAPVLTLNGSGTITIPYGSGYVESGATRTDTYNGTGTATISGSVNTGITGTYILSYSYVDQAGNTGNIVTRTVTITGTIATTTTTGGTTTTSRGGGGGTLLLYTDIKLGICEKDYSTSSYDRICGTGEVEKIKIVKPAASIKGSNLSTELKKAYLRAYEHDIITTPTIQRANMKGKLLRIDMAKMVTNFVINVLDKDISTGIICSFSDTSSLSKEKQYYVIAACRLGLMGYESDGIRLKKKFNPNQEVDRAQFGTVLSRLLWIDENNGGTPYYQRHLNALKKEGIMTKIATPKGKEIRGWIMLMMQRIFENK